MPALPETEAMNLLQTISSTWAQYRAFQAALAELESYSERELTELGITARRHPAHGLCRSRAARPGARPEPRPAHDTRVLAGARGLLSPSFQAYQSDRRRQAAPSFFHDMEVHDAHPEHP